MDISPRLIIHESAHWRVNHRINSALPGYLMRGNLRLAPIP